MMAYRSHIICVWEQLPGRRLLTCPVTPNSGCVGGGEEAKVKGHRARLTCTNTPQPLMPPLKKTRCGFHGVSLNEEGQDAIVYVLGCHSFNTE